MSRQGMLIKQTIIYFIGSFGSKILSFLLLPIYSNYLTQTAYGNYDLINTVVQIVYPMITLMFDNAIYVFLIGEKDEENKYKVISCAEKVLLINSLVVIFVILIVNLVHPMEYAGWIIAWIISYSAYGVWSQICRGLNMSKIYSGTGVILTAITLIGNIVGLVILKLDYEALMVSNCVAYFIAIVFMETKVHALPYLLKASVRNSELWKKLFRYSLPLIPNQIGWWILNVSDRLMLTYYLGASANGVYAMACKIPTILMVFHSIFSLAWADDILSSADMKETQEYAEKVYNKYIRIMLGLTIVLMAANRFVFEYIIAGNFVEAYRYTYFLYVGCIFNALGSCLGAFYGYYKKSLNVSLSTFLAAIVNIVINLLFINKFGIEAASFSTFLGFVVMWLVRLLGLRGMVKIRISTSNKMMLLLLVPFYFTYRIEGLVPNLILICCGALLAVATNWNVVVAFLMKGKLILTKRGKKEENR